MADRDAAFVGTIPEHYDRHLGPLLFHDMADEMAARLDVPAGARVLETACGTGIVTRRLLGRLGERGHLVATDLNAPMLAHAASRLPASDRLEWRQADATSLPFDERSFDALVCQFGWMFFPDKAAGARAAFRVLRPGARLLLSVWDRLDDNPVPRITHETIATFFSSNPPQFYTVPFTLHDPALVERFLRDAGFDEIRWQRVERVGESPSAREAATGLIEGNPVYQDIMDRWPEALTDIEATIAARLRAALGDEPLRAPLRAVFFSARRPAR
ncbi:MAG TPA: methyltransferase domain-containing protein [Methylomirabilota bacterium]|nr:methyltransferase domain-containing protein [Methylomirabilota bacterium]